MNPASLDLRSIAKSLPTLFVLAVMATGWFVVHRINERGQATHEAEGAGEDPISDTLTLSIGKLEAARFESVPAQSHPIQHVHTVPGRIRYDEAKHIDVKAPMDGILTEVFVTPGQQVETGHLLAVLRSPEIGQARAEILKRQQQCEIARLLLQRETTLAKNVELLMSMLEEGKSMESIEASFKDRDLGNYRQEILSTYSKMRLSSELLARIEPLANSGSVAGRVFRERESERQVFETAFRTARDQAMFSANQSKLKAEAELAEADRQCNLAWQAVESLVGYKEDRQTADLSTEDALSRLEVRAPMTGSVESRNFANNERVARGNSLMVLANTDSLYVSASIREGDWSAVALQPGTILSVAVPALQDRVFPASIRYVGREVQADTNSIPLVAVIQNDERLLRPGMFVRVTVPIGPPRQALAIKPESVMQHENKSFVFVDKANGNFQRIDVSIGQASEEWVEVTQGLSPGQLVVTNGAFLLKSELLLRGGVE
ncbi:MAG: efflux RND transporter periplasmic adaptor subunit [Pirellula sp.]